MWAARRAGVVHRPCSGRHPDRRSADRRPCSGRRPDHRSADRHPGSCDRRHPGECGRRPQQWAAHRCSDPGHSLPGHRHRHRHRHDHVDAGVDAVRRCRLPARQFAARAFPTRWQVSAPTVRGNPVPAWNHRCAACAPGVEVTSAALQLPGTRSGWAGNWPGRTRCPCPDPTRCPTWDSPLVAHVRARARAAGSHTRVRSGRRNSWWAIAFCTASSGRSIESTTSSWPAACALGSSSAKRFLRKRFLRFAIRWVTASSADMVNPSLLVDGHGSGNPQDSWSSLDRSHWTPVPAVRWCGRASWLHGDDRASVRTLRRTGACAPTAPVRPPGTRPRLRSHPGRRTAAGCR